MTSRSHQLISLIAAGCAVLLPLYSWFNWLCFADYFGDDLAQTIAFCTLLPLLHMACWLALAPLISSRGPKGSTTVMLGLATLAQMPSEFDGRFKSGMLTKAFASVIWKCTTLVGPRIPKKTNETIATNDMTIGAFRLGLRSTCENMPGVTSMRDIT